MYSRIPFYEKVKGNVKLTCNVLEAAYPEKKRESEREEESYEKYDAIFVSWSKNILLVAFGKETLK